jgi:hypothetical protein
MKIQQAIRATGLSADEVLSGLAAERQTLFGELYAKRR